MIHLSSVLKRKYERDVLFDEIRNRHYSTKFSKLEINYYIIDCFKFIIYLNYEIMKL